MEETMSTKKGWIAIHRKTEESEIWIQKPWRFKTWIYFLLEANHSNTRKAGEKLKRGQIYVPSAKELCKEVSWYEGCVYRKPSVEAMKQFWKTLREKGMVDTRKTTRGTIITILNYKRYQDFSPIVDIGKKTFVDASADTTQTPANPYDRQQCNNGTKNISPKEIISLYKDTLLIEKKKKIRINYSACSKIISSLLEREKWRKADFEKLFRWFVDSKKAKDYGYSLTVCLSTHTLNLFEEQKEIKKWEYEK